MTISAAQLAEGTVIMVRGKITFSRLTKLVEGVDLQRSIENARKRGSLYPTQVPHTLVNITDAHILPAGAQLSPEEQYLQEKQFYTAKSGDNAGKVGFGAENKTRRLPQVFELDPENPGSHRQLVLPSDLATGLDVILSLRVFKSGDNANRGIGLEQVILMEPVRYFQGAGAATTSALAARGITITGEVTSVEAPATGGTPSVADASATLQHEAAQNGYPLQNTAVAPGGLPMPAPGAQGTAPQAFPVPGAPVQQQAPVYPTQVQQQAFPVPGAQAQPQTPIQQQAPAQPQAFPVPGAQQAPAPVAQQGGAVAQAPGESTEAYIARLQASVAEASAAAAGSGGASAFGTAPSVPVGAGAPSPWDIEGTAPGVFQG